MAAARSRQDVARLLRAHDLPAPVDEAFVAVLAAQARDTAGTAVAAPPRRALKLAGAAVAVVASTVGVAVAANQGLFVPPDPARTPPVTTTSDDPAPGPVDADDATEDQTGTPDASGKSAPREHRADAPDADDDSSAVETEEAPEQSRPAKPERDRTKGGTGGEDGSGQSPADDTSGDDETDDGTDDGSSDDGSSDGPDASESPEPGESETAEPDSDGGAESSETSDPEPDQASESAGVDESAEDAVSG